MDLQKHNFHRASSSKQGLQWSTADGSYEAMRDMRTPASGPKKHLSQSSPVRHSVDMYILGHMIS